MKNFRCFERNVTGFVNVMPFVYEALEVLKYSRLEIKVCCLC